MALLDDQIEEAQAAFVAAHEAQDAEGAQVLADHIRELEAQKAAVDKAALESSKEGANVRNPMIAGAVGAVVGAATNPLRGAVHDIITPPQNVAPPPKMTAPAPTGAMPQGNTPFNPRGRSIEESVGNWSNYADAQTEAARGVRRDNKLLKKYPNMQLGPLGSAATPAPAPAAPVPPTMGEKGTSLLKGLVADHQPNSPFSIVKGGARGAVTGAALADAPQQIAQGNYGTAAADTGIGAGNILHGLARTPKGKALGALIGIGSGATRAVQGVNELMPEEQKATGGLVHLAGGGVANALTQTAINAPFIAPTASGIVKNVAKGAYAPAIEDTAALGLAMAPLNPLTVGLSLMAPGEAGAGSTVDDWKKQKAAEEAARQRAQKQFEHEEFMRTKVGANAPKYFENYLTQKAPSIPKFGIGGEVLKSVSKNIKLPSQAFKAAPEQTVTDPLRNAFPGIYKRPDVIASEAAARVAPENEAMKRLFGVSRDDLYQMGKGRVGNISGVLPGAAANPKGSKAAIAVMNPQNEQRLLDVLSESEKHPELVRGMDPWYIMDPAYKRLEELVGPEEAVKKYRQLNTLTGMASPGSDVLTEMNRGTAANYLATQGRFGDFVDYAGLPFGARGAGFPEDLRAVMGHPYHKTAQATPMQKYLESGEVQMSSPKVPMYIDASGVPQTGFQTDMPVGDAHWSRAVGLADTRGTATRKGKEVVPGASVSNPEMSQLGPWWRDKIASQVGLESVPAQARAWGAFSPQTGVESPIGAPKLELLSMKIMEAANRYGVSPEQARDMILKGEGYAGKKEGGPIEAYAPGGKVLSAIKKMSEEAQAAYKAKFTPGFYHGSPSNKIKAFDASKGDRAFPTEGVTFLTKEPEFAHSFIDVHKNKKTNTWDYDKGSTIYPVSANLGKHFDPATPEGSEAIKQYLQNKYSKEAGTDYFDDVINQKHEYMMDRLTDPVNNWKLLESPGLLDHLKNTGHNSFSVTEGGIKNVGVFNPADIRGKFAKFNPEHADDPDFMKAEGGLIHLAGGGKIPEAVVKAYKLFRTKGGNTDELYPLFVNANKPVPLNEWVNAEVGPVAASGKVKSKLGELAYRPGWHAGDLPVATHIGGKSAPELKAPDFRRPDEVWAEVEMPADVDWQQIANQRARLNKAGQPIASTAHITDAIPEGGFYRYKTSPNMQGNWLIGGGMKVNKVLTDEEVQAINEAAGVADLPRFTPFPKK